VPAREVPAWSSPREACRLILRGLTLRTGVKVAAVVGTILTIVNQGSVIAGGDATAVTWIRVAVNYLVPFFVSSIGYLAPFGRRVPRVR
jgi:thiamine transporter ThiT